MDVDVRLALEKQWNNLTNTQYKIASKHTLNYNCFAWAVNDENDRWWSPTPDDDYYWPDGAPREETLESYIIAFQMCGYEICSDEKIEPGFVKIAIYVAEDGTPKHAAKQLSDGMWTSKLGELEDISHELDGLVGNDYGKVQQFMKRAL